MLKSELNTKHNMYISDYLLNKYNMYISTVNYTH